MVGVSTTASGGERFRLDPSYRRTGDGSVIIGGSPLRLFRLTAAGRGVATAVECGEPLPGGHEALTDRLYDAGAIHRVIAAVPDRTSRADRGVTAVVPVYTDSCRIIGPVDDAGRTLVVDDAGPCPVDTGGLGAELITRCGNGGPGAARNTGLAAVTTPLVAFVDLDVVVSPGWLEPLLGHFADPEVGLVAARVRSAAGGSNVVDRDEALHGSLDLGPQEGRVAPGTRTGYVPGAAIVCRTEAVRAIGGFDEELRYGEDVDLVWRLHEAGWRCRYEPAVEVLHVARPTWRAWLGQRYRYGTSAAPLARRHPGALAPLRISGWSAAVWTMVMCRRPAAGVAVALGTVVALQRKLYDVPPADSAALAALGHLHAGAQIAAALRRAWWPLALLGALASPRTRPWLAAAVGVPPTAEWFRARRRARRGEGPRPAGLATFVGMRIADDVAYGAGVWSGCGRIRSFDALRPDLANWPARRPTTVGPR